MKGNLSARITNDVTKRSKNIRIANSNLGASVFETIYESPALKAANVLEWPSEIKEKLTEGTCVIQMAVVSEDASPVAVLSFDEMKTTSLQQLINGSGVSGAIKLVLKCEEEDPNAPKLSASDDMASPEKAETVFPETAPFTPDVAAETPNAAKRTPNTSTSRSGARIRITNTFTERSKNIRIGPSNLSDSIHDTIYNHPGIQASKILEWPAETEEALNTGLMEVQSFVEGTETSFSFAEMKSAPVSELFDLVSDETIIPLSIRAVGIPQGEDGERNASADEEAKKAEEEEARRKEEEKAFWAAEEARLLSQAEERKRQKEGKMKAILAAEQAAKQKAQEEADQKEAAIKAEEAFRLARREAQKKAAMEAEKSARMEAEEQRKYYEEQESNQHNEGVEMLKSKRRASVVSEQLARSQAKPQRTMKREEDEEEAHAMDAMLEAEEQQELVNLEQAEETAKGHRESTAILAAEELAELSRLEEDVLAEYDRKNAEEAAKREAEYMAHREAEDAIRRSNEEELDRVLKTKEIEHEENERVEHERRENARMQALEERAAVIQQEALRPKKVDSPKDRTVRWEEARKRKAGVLARLQKVEQTFVPDASRKRSPDVVPLSLEFNVFLRKLRLALKHSKAYQGARQEMEAARCSLLEDFSSLSKETPLHEYVGKMLDPDQTTNMTANEAQHLADDTGIKSFFSVNQVSSMHEQMTEAEYHEQVLDYTTEWDYIVTTTVEKAMMLHKKLEQDVLHYENKVARLRSKAHETEAKGRLLSSQQSERLNRNEMKLNDSWQIHELACGSLCNLFEEIAEYGWHELYPLVKSTIEWEINRLEREKSTFGFDLPAILAQLKAIVSDSPTDEQKAHLKKELEVRRAENRCLEHKVNKLEAALHQSWTSKAELLKMLKDTNVEI